MAETLLNAGWETTQQQYALAGDAQWIHGSCELVLDDSIIIPCYPVHKYSGANVTATVPMERVLIVSVDNYELDSEDLLEQAGGDWSAYDAAVAVYKYDGYPSSGPRPYDWQLGSRAAPVPVGVFETRRVIVTWTRGICPIVAQLISPRFANKNRS